MLRQGAFFQRRSDDQRQGPASKGFNLTIPGVGAGACFRT